MTKVLVLHPDPKQIEVIITKVNALNKKSGPFGLVILIGINELDIDSIKQGPTLDIPAYFTDGVKKLKIPSTLNGNISDNLTYLGDYGIFTSADGISLAYITGDEQFQADNEESIRKTFEGKTIDILISYQWPKAISTEQKLFFGNSKIDGFVAQLKPKYHFAVGSDSGKFHERSPFKWDDEGITRFISLAKYGGSEKWIYAFNHNTTSNGLPKNVTENPILEAQKKALEEQESLKRKNDEAIEQANKRQRKVIAPENCFFCLSNSKVESHMIISIGEHAYLTIAKGPLTRPTDTMKFSGHCLIIPIAHLPNLEAIGEEESVIKTPLYNEILRYEASLVKLYASFNLATIFFQINKSDSIHFHIQAFPIASDFLVDFGKVLAKNVKLNNTKYARNTKLEFEKFESSDDERYLEILNSKQDYISFTIFDQSIQKQTIYISHVEFGKSLDLQFGRRVLAFLLQTPKRIKWDACTQSHERETLETEHFKSNYKEFDFTADL